MRSFFSELRLYLCNEWVCKIPSHGFRQWYYRNVMGFFIGDRSAILMHCTFDSTIRFSIGNNSVINSKCRLDTRGEIIIGENVSISQEVVILTADHEMDSEAFLGRTRKVMIEDYVWIGTRAMIMPGVIIGKGAVVAAGAVVTKNVEPFSLVAGIPAKFVRTRNKDLNYNIFYQRLFQ